jgi:hypothetical protein
MKNPFWLAVLLATTCDAMTLSGIVSDTASNNLPGVSINLTETGGNYTYSTITDANGAYFFYNINWISIFKLSLRRSGYAPKDSLIMLWSFDKVINIKLLAPSSIRNGFKAKNDMPPFSIHFLQDRKTLVLGDYGKTPFRVTVHDMAGRCLYKNDVSGTLYPVFLPFALPSGTYTGTIISQGATSTGKFILP